MPSCHAATARSASSSSPSSRCCWPAARPPAPTPRPAPSLASPATAASPSAGADPTVSAGPLLTALDVCSLATPAQVRRAAGQAGEPTSRQLTTIHGYGGLVDQCGFGVSFDSYTFVVSVGLAPATRADLARLPGEPVDGVGDAARAADQAAVHHRVVPARAARSCRCSP